MLTKYWSILSEDGNGRQRTRHNTGVSISGRRRRGPTAILDQSVKGVGSDGTETLRSTATCPRIGRAGAGRVRDTVRGLVWAAEICPRRLIVRLCGHGVHLFQSLQTKQSILFILNMWKFSFIS